MKICKSCGEEKPLSEFNKSARLLDGYSWHCRVCVNLSKRADNATIHGRCCTTLTAARNRAKKKNISFTLNYGWIKPKLQKGLCEITGFSFRFMNPLNTQADPFAPSIDRIDSTKGYTTSNSRLVVFAWNMFCGEWGEQHALEVLESYLKNNPKQLQLL